MAAWKIAPALACGNTVVLKPAETTPLTALQAGRDHPGCGSAAGRGEHRHRRGRNRARRSSNHPGRRQDRVHRLHRGRQADRQARRPGTDEETSRSNSAAKRRTSSSTMRRSTRRSKASSTGSSSTRATSAAPARGCFVQEACPMTGSSASCRIACRRCASAIRWTRTPTSARSIRKMQLEKINGYLELGEAEGAESVPAGCDAAAKGLLVSADAVSELLAVSHRVAQEEIFGPVLAVLTFRTPEEAIEKANNTPYGLSAGVWTDKGSEDLQDQLASSARAWCGRTPTTSSTRPARSAATKKAASAARAGCMGCCRMLNGDE